MAVTITEKFESRALTWTESHERIYLILGTDSEDTAKTTLLATAPTTAHGLVRGDCSVEPIAPYEDPDNPGTILIPGAWLGVAPYIKASYATIDELTLGQIRITYDTGGASQHITQSKSTISKTAAAGVATDHKGAIGVTKDSVEGVDIGLRQMRFTVTKVFEVGSLPAMGTVYALTWRVNDAQFSVTDSLTGQSITLDAGECILMGVSGPTLREDGYAELRYEFGAAPNETNIVVGDITVPAKKGWEYLWVQYEDKEDGSSHDLAKRPKAAYVEKVYDTGDFSGLGL